VLTSIIFDVAIGCEDLLRNFADSRQDSLDLFTPPLDFTECGHAKISEQVQVAVIEIPIQTLRRV
jgi:hypothetical protein